jgi:hypothetical protein
MIRPDKAFRYLPYASANRDQQASREPGANSVRLIRLRSTLARLVSSERGVPDCLSLSLRVLASLT